MSRRRFRPTDAFVDESIRGQRYLMGCVLLEAHHLAEVRSTMADLAVFERVHFNNESQRQKTRVLEAIATMPVSVLVVVFHRRQGLTEFAARAACLTAIVDRLQTGSVGRLVIESRDDDREDVRQLLRIRRPHPPLVFEHRQGSDEPMLWVADAVTWAVGAGGRWRQAVDAVVENTIELRP